MNSNKKLAQSLISRGCLKTESIINAFEKVDRADFVPARYLSEAYGDYPLPIGEGQTISQPATVAFMLELLQPQAGEKILDVGSGSGWTTALLAQIIGVKGRVIGLERVPELVKLGRKNIKRYDFKQAVIKQAGDKLGLASEAPFDKILVSAAASGFPDELLKQLNNGGRLIIPVNNSIWEIQKTIGGQIKKREFPGFAFVPLIS